MTRSEIIAILGFLDGLRQAEVFALGIPAPNPVWQMTLALLRRHYEHKQTTITALAEASGASYTTSLRIIDRMIRAGLLVRIKDPRTPKLVFIEPTAELLNNFLAHARLLKTRVGTTFGLAQPDRGDFVFGATHLGARILPPPARPATRIGLEGPLRLLLKDEPTFLALQRLGNIVSDALGHPVEIEVLDYAGLHQQVRKNARNSTSAYDIIALDAPWLGRIAQEGGLLPLDELLRRSTLNPFDHHAAAWELGRSRRTQLALPFAPTAEVLAYRHDLFETAGLDPPETVDAVWAGARHLHDPARNIYGIAWNAARGQPLGQTFVQVMGSFGAPPVSLNRTGAGHDIDTSWDALHPQIDSEAGHRTLDYLSSLIAWSPPDIAQMGWHRRTEVYRAGHAAMAYAWSTHTMAFDELRDTRYLPHPASEMGAGIAPMGGFVLGLPGNLAPERRRPAWRALEWLARPEFAKVLVRNGSPCRFHYSVNADPDVPPPLPAVDATAQMERAGLLQVWPRPPVPCMTSIMQIIGETVHDALFARSPGNPLALCDARIAPLLDGLRR